MRNGRLLIAATVLLVVGVGCITKSTVRNQPVLSKATPAPQPPTGVPSPDPKNSVAAVPKDIDFGYGNLYAGDERYSLLHIADGTSRPFVPTGYIILDQQAYSPFPTHLIVLKDRQLYSFDMAASSLKPVLSEDELLAKYDQPRIFPSITQSGKFFIAVDAYGDEEPQQTDIGGYVPPKTVRSYIFDAEKNALTAAKAGAALLSTCIRLTAHFRGVFSQMRLPILRLPP
jgi:hypothetical protein